MELSLSLGDSSRPFVGFMEKPNNHEVSSNRHELLGFGLGFNTTLSIGPIINNTTQRDHQQEEEEEKEAMENRVVNNPVMHQLDLLPQLSLPWLPSQNGSFSGELGSSLSKGLDVNVLPLKAVAAAEDEADEGAALSSSPNSAGSSFRMDLCMFRGGSGGGSFSGSGGGNYYSNYGGRKRDSDGEAYDHHHQRDSSRASDEDGDGDGGDGGGSGGARKKLRLSQEQSAYLEESFKEHNTLNPKQKLALAKQLNLRPRQVEVWFQNRRARTKLKQTEVDCEYLKRCCETLTNENRRLQKELQELRALKSSNPFYMQLPATTLTMCPSCERVVTNSTSSSAAATKTPSNTAKSIVDNDSITPKDNIGLLFPVMKPRLFHHQFSHTDTPQQHTNQSTAS